MIKSWPTFEWYPPSSMAEWPVWWHIGTQVRDDLDDCGRRFGDTVWMASLGGTPVGAAWEWTEFRPGVVLLSDPNSVISNLRVLAEDQSLADPLQEIVTLNRIANVLPWQDAVCLTLQAMQQPGPPAELPFARGAFAGRRRPAGLLAAA